MRALNLIFPTFVAFLLLLPAHTFADESWNIDQVGSLYNNWYAALSVDVYLNYAYVATNNQGVAILDVTDPTDPVLLNSIYTDERVTFVYVHDGLLFVTGSALAVADPDLGLRILDLADPENPVEIGSFVTGDKLVVIDDIAYVGGDSFYILDISDPTNPVTVGSHPASCSDFSISGNYAYLCRGSGSYYEFYVLDISTPDLVHSVYSFSSENIFYAIASANDYLYISMDWGIDIYEYASNPEEPQYINSIYTTRALNIYIHENTLYSCLDLYGLYVYDISSPTSPSLLSIYDEPGRYYDLIIDNNRAFVANYLYDLLILDVNDPESLSELGQYRTGLLYGVSTDDNYAYLADSQEGFRILDITNLNSPQEISHLSEFTANYIDVSGDVAVTGNNTIYIVDVSDRMNPTVTYEQELDASCSDMLIHDNYVLVLGHSYLTIYDISDPYDVSIVSSFYIYNGSYFGDICVVNNYAYILSSYCELYLLDFNDMDNLEHVFTFNFGVKDLDICNNMLYASEYDRLVVYDISDLYNPLEIGYHEWDESMTTFQLEVEDGFAYLTTDEMDILIINVQDINNAIETGFYDYDKGFAQQIAITNDLIFAAAHYSFLVLDSSAALPVTEQTAAIPTQLTFSPAWPNPFNAATTFSVELPHPSQLRVNVFNATGQQVATLANSQFSPGTHAFTFDASGLASGVYFIRADVSGQTLPPQRLVLLK